MASSRVGKSRPNGNFDDGDNASTDLDKDYELLMRYPEKVDYYSLLGLSRSPPPTDSQLQSAYHNLSLSLHPDKQPAHLVESANAQFRLVQEAYKILSDPKKRIVYDLEGEEGVQREWSASGPMAARMENEDSGLGQVGPRAMSPAEFRRWFIARMKAKERTALNRLVGAKASMSVTIDASSLISPGEEEGEVDFNFPPPKLRASRFVLGYSFKTALPDFAGAWTWFSGRQKDTEEETSAESEKVEEESRSPPEVTFHANVSGAIRPSKQAFRLPTPDGKTEVVKIDGPPFLGAATFNLGATINHQFTTAGLLAVPQSKFGLRSLLEGASVGGTVTILPARALALHMEKQVYPFPNSKPFTVLVKSNIPSNVNNFMPNITTSIVRQFGSKKFGTLSYSTGSHLTWPSFMRGFLSPFMDMSLDPRLEPMLVNDGSLQIQYTSLSSPTAEEVSNDPDFAKSAENEVWQWGFAATPAQGQLSLTYGRTFFADRLEDVPRSEWNLDGYHPTIPLPDRRGVRVEVEAAVDFDGDMAWSITASRRVAEFTNMGLGVSLRDARGLVLSFSWRRLGQTIRVPILICPLDLADAEISVIAVIVPWLTYIGVEFGYIRPRERRRRREAIIRKRKQLKAQLSARRKESAQQIELMSDLTRRRQAREEDKGGLVVEKAEYGYFPPKNAKRAESEVIDVTIPVAAQVDKSQLFISKNTIRFQIIGFYDPAPLLPKTLKVWYTFRGQRHYAEAKDGEDLACPRREHILISDDFQLSSSSSRLRQPDSPLLKPHRNHRDEKVKQADKMCSRTCIDCFLEDWCGCWCPDAVEKSRRRRGEDPERESVMVRRYVDGRHVTTIETRPRRRSRSAAYGGNTMSAPLPYGVTRTTGNTNAEDSNRERGGRGGRQEGPSSNQNGGGRNNDDRPAIGGNQGKDVGVQTTDSLLNLGAGASASGSGNQQDNQGKGKGKNKKNNNQDDNQHKKQDNNEDSNKDTNQENNTNKQQNNNGGKKNKNKNKEKPNQDSGPQEESSKVNDRSDETKDKAKDKGKGKANDDSKPQDSGTNNKKNVHFSESENKEKETKPEESGGTSEWPAADEAPSEWETNTGDNSATGGNEASGWGTIIGDNSATAANEATSEWNNEATEIANIDCKNSRFQTKDRNPNTRQGRTRRRTRSNSRARSHSYKENERNTRPFSCEPVLGIDKEYKHWACDSEGRFSLRSRAEIDEQYQPGEWEEDEGGRYEYFRSYTGW